MKGIPDSSCGRKASVTSWRFRALNSYCNANLVLFGATRKVWGFFSSRIILASDFLIFAGFAKKELPGSQQKA